MEATTISSKFQVVIPKNIRLKYNLKPGYKMVFIPFENTLRVVFAPPLDQGRGMFPDIDTSIEREEEDRCGRQHPPCHSPSPQSHALDAG